MPNSTSYDIINGRKYKKCKANQIRNPLTNRCINIKIDKKVDKKIDNKIESPKIKTCPEGKVLNPLTKRCVKIKVDNKKKKIDKIESPKKKIDKIESPKKKIDKIENPNKKIDKIESSKIKVDKKTNIINEKLKYKLEKIREKIKKDKDIYISKEHEDICFYYKKYKEYLKIKKNKKITFSYLDDKIYYDNSKKYFLTLRKTNKNISFAKKNISIEITYNPINKSFINKLQKTVDIDYIQSIFKEQDKFFKSLSVREVFNLKHYTFHGDNVLNSYINNTLNISNINIDYNNETTFFYQFLDYFIANPIYNGNKVPIDDDEKFIDFLKNNYYKFDMSIYTYILNLYIKEIKAIFDKAPKNKQKFYVYRGVNDNYISKKVAQNKSKGYFTSDRYVSTSLFINEALRFIGNGNDNIIYEIAIEPNVPIIFMQSISYVKNEFEVLLPINSTFFIEYALKKRTLFTDKSLICFDSKDEKGTKTINMTCLSYFDYNKVNENNNKYKSPINKEKINIRLLEKLRKIREKLKEDKYEYANKEHETVCYYYYKFLELSKNVKEEIKTLKLNVSLSDINVYTRYNILIEHIKNNNNITTFTEDEIIYRMKYNANNYKFINADNYLINVDAIQNYINQQTSFFKSLSLREVYTLKYFVLISDKIDTKNINSINAKELTYLRLIEDGAFLYFQFKDYFTKNPIFNNNNVDVNDIEKFLSFISNNKNNFNDLLYNTVFKIFLKDVNDIFLKSPKTTDNFYVYSYQPNNFIKKSFYKTNRFMKGQFIISYYDIPHNYHIYQIYVKKGVSLLFLTPFFSKSNKTLVCFFPISSNFYVDYANNTKTLYNTYFHHNIVCDYNGIIYKSSDIIYYGL